MKRLLILVTIFTLGFSTYVLTPRVSAATSDIAISTLRADHTWWRKGIDDNALQITFRNTSAAPRSKVAYRVVFSNMHLPVDASKVVYTKTGTVSLAANGAKTIRITLSSATISKKFKEGSYNAEVFVDGVFIHSTTFSVVDKSSLTSTLRVFSAYDNRRLPVNTALPVFATIGGTVKKDSTLWFQLVYQNGATRFLEERKVPKGYKGTMMIQVPYRTIAHDGSSFESFEKEQLHRVIARILSPTSSGNSLMVAYASSSSYFFVE